MNNTRVLEMGFVALFSAALSGGMIGCGSDDEDTAYYPPASGGSAGGGGATGGSGGTSAGGTGGTSAGGTGGTSAGGTGGTGTGGTGATGGSTGQPWQWFAIGDERSNWSVFEDNIRSMWALDPTAVAVFSTGDITPEGLRDQWDDHHTALADGAPDNTVPQDPLGIVRQSHVRTDVSDWGPYIRYFGVMGNHDDGNGEWLTNWNDYLPGQANLGENSENGIYYSVTYDNAIFIALDSVNTSSEQTAWLDGVLQSPEATNAEWKFAYFHRPVYNCCPSKSPFDRGLDWVTLFEQYNVDVVFLGDTHTYERTCPMLGGSCASGGVVYLNSSGAGAGTRDVDPSISETISESGRTDSFDCSEILDAYQGNWHHFTHVKVEGCRLETNAYSHDHHSTGEAAFDTMVIDKCN